MEKTHIEIETNFMGKRCVLYIYICIRTIICHSGSPRLPHAVLRA